MIVVDTNVIAYLLVPGSEYARAARELYDVDSQWSAPRLWRSEFRNLLAGCLRRNALTFEQVCAIQAEGERIVYDEHESASEDILMAVRDSRCSAYDCEYVALAIELESPLVTADKALLRAFPAVAVPLI